MKKTLDTTLMEKEQLERKIADLQRQMENLEDRVVEESNKYKALKAEHDQMIAELL